MFATLEELGWQRSVREKASVDASGAALPWWTYSATRWLDRALNSTHRVFEFGSGNSTLWLADRVASLQSVEHEPEWVEKVRPRLPANASLDFVATNATDADAAQDDNYLKPLTEQGEPFDLIIVDGMGRNACVKASIDRLAADGLLLLDDADRNVYRPAHAALREAGFGRLDFFGPKPGVGYMSTTCLFSRDFNRWTRDLDEPPVSGY